MSFPVKTVEVTDSLRPISVRAHGMTWWDKALQAVVLAVTPIAVVEVTIFAPPPYPIDFVPRLITALVLVAGADLFIEAMVSTRRVDIDSAGVTFHYLLHKERGAWKDLSPGVNPPGHGVWFVGRRRYSGPMMGLLPVRGHLLTLEQARAVLSCPQRPRWDIDPGVLRTINGVPAARIP